MNLANFKDIVLHQIQVAFVLQNIVEFLSLCKVWMAIHVTWRKKCIKNTVA